MSIEKSPAAIKFKQREKDFENVLQPRSIYGIRLDGKSFHTFTKGFAVPFDRMLMDAMNEATISVMDRIFSGTALIGYTQSDEITILFSDLKGKRRDLPLGGRVSKILSLSAAAAATSLTRSLLSEMSPDSDLPLFDARLFEVRSVEEGLENIHWRRLDARKNAISMAAQTVLSSKQLHGMSTSDRWEALQGTHWEVLPDDFFNGRLISADGEVSAATKEKTERDFSCFELFAK